MSRILVIRGGAIGDFILTLPAIRLLRENFPDCHLEILGYRHIAALAERRYYAHATRSIEYGPLAGFFNPKSELDAGLSEYFASFQQIVSYLYDPDRLFETSLRKSGVKNLLTGSPKLHDDAHAAYQLARPLEQLALWLDEPAAKIFPSSEDLAAAESILSGLPSPLVAIHPGSGGERKNWPGEKWLALTRHLLGNARTGHLLVIGGESDTKVLFQMKSLPSPRVTFLENLPLPVLGAVLSRCSLFAGHDSGISHLAAAAGAPCLLLFGPTDPEVWAPANKATVVLRAPEGDLSRLEMRDVLEKLEEMLSDAR